MARIAVVGAGISGLSCAFDLARAGAEPIVLEAAARPGGVVGSFELGGARFENGPNTIPASAATFRRLAGDLGIASRLIVSRPEAKRRYLFHAGRLRVLPKGPGGLVTTRLLSLSSKLKILSEPMRRARIGRDGEPSFEAFLTERIGREATRRLAGAFVRGVYAAEIEELGARSAFPRLFELVHEHGGLVRGMLKSKRGVQETLPGPDVSRTDLLSFPNGLEELVDALVQALGGQLRTSARVESIERDGSGFRLRLAGGEELLVDRTVLAVPAPHAADLLQACTAPVTGIATLRAIRHADVTLAHLVYDADFLIPGFGYLVPPEETDNPSAPRVLGTLFVSQLFEGRAPLGKCTLTSFYRTSDVDMLDEAALVERAHEDVERALCPELRLDHLPAPETARVQRWRNVIPRYAVGHAEAVRVLRRSLAETVPGIHLAGSYVGGVSVEDCLACGRAVAREISS